jgi:hypothetical protein
MRRSSKLFERHDLVVESDLLCSYLAGETIPTDIAWDILLPRYLLYETVDGRIKLGRSDPRQREKNISGAKRQLRSHLGFSPFSTRDSWIPIFTRVIDGWCHRKKRM